MVEKGLGRESDDVIVGVKAEGLKRFIVQIVIKKIVHNVRNQVDKKSRNVTDEYYLYLEE